LVIKHINKVYLIIVAALIILLALSWIKKDDLPFNKEEHLSYSSNNSEIKWVIKPEGYYRYFHAVPLFVNSEIVVGSYSKSIFFINGKTGEVTRTFDLPKKEKGFVGCNNLMAFDIDRDGNKEILFGTEGPPISVYCIDFNTLEVIWETQLEGNLIAGGINAINNQGIINIVVGTRKSMSNNIDGKLYKLDGAGKIIFEIDNQDICSNTPNIQDINNDGKYEIIHGNHIYQNADHGGAIIARELEDGDVIFATQTKGNTGSNTIKTFDFEQDGDIEMVGVSCAIEGAPGTPTSVFIVNNKGTILRQIEGYNTNPVIANSSGMNYVMVSNSITNKLGIYDYDKDKVIHIINNVHLVRGCNAIDIDNDGKMEIVTVNKDKVVVINIETGKILEVFSLGNRYEITVNITGLSLVDSDNDGKIEIVCVSSMGHIFAFDTNAISTIGKEKFYNY